MKLQAIKDSQAIYKLSNYAKLYYITNKDKQNK
jgi:hypothetical protein